LGSTDVSFEASILITFSNTVDAAVRTKMTSDEGFSDSIKDNPGNNAGSAKDAIFSWSANGRVFSISGITGFAHLLPGAGDKDIDVSFEANKVSDVFGQFIPVNTPAIRYTLKGIPSIEVTGTVNFAWTTDGVKGGVYLSYSGPTTGETLSDQISGSYQIANCQSGTYTIVATKEGWATTTEAVVVNGVSVAQSFGLFFQF